MMTLVYCLKHTRVPKCQLHCFLGMRCLGSRKLDLELVSRQLMNFLGCKQPKLGVLILDARAGILPGQGAMCHSKARDCGQDLGFLISKMQRLEISDLPANPSSESCSFASQCQQPTQTIELDYLYTFSQKRTVRTWITGKELQQFFHCLNPCQALPVALNG